MLSSRSPWFVTAAIYGDQLLAKALLFGTRLTCLDRSPLPGLLQLRAVTLEPEVKSTKTATGDLS